MKYWLLHKVLACVVFHKSESNRISTQEMFLMWCIHYKKPICWTYWIFNQLLSCAPRKEAPLTHGHVITIIAKALNINFDAYTRKVDCSYFTNHAFIRGEVVDARFHFIPTRSCSCWHGLAGSSRVVESPPAYQTESEHEEDLPQYQHFGDVPLLTYPLQSAPGSSSDHPPIWDQILNNQIAMQNQLNDMEFQNKQLARRQRKMEYKLNQYFAHSGYPIESPPTTPIDD